MSPTTLGLMTIPEQEKTGGIEGLTAGRGRFVIVNGFGISTMQAM
jgi:hypothetical protein